MASARPARDAACFAQALMEALPDLPVEDEGRLQDATIRENFIQRVFAYHSRIAL